MRRTLAGLAGLLLGLGLGHANAQTPAPAPTPDKVISVGVVPSRTFEALWAEYRRADESGNEESRQKTLQDILWYRVERNIVSLDSIALALVTRGQDQLRKGNRDKAETNFKNAIELDPHLADAYYGLAAAKVKKGPVGIFAAIGDVGSAMTARLGSAEGRYALLALAISVGLATLFATAAAFAVAMMVRHGALLLHDIEESVGLGSRAAAIGVFVVFLMVPMMTLQGYGWLPLWWITLLFVYLGRLEQVVAGMFLVFTLAVGPAVGLIESHVRAEQNPLLRASLRSIESGPDARAIADLQAAIEKDFPEDRDLRYLLAVQFKKSGRYEDAAAVYRAIRTADPKDSIALNNLANIQFAEGTYYPAETQYLKATELGRSPRMLATYFYNLSLARLQQFKYQPSHEARAEADRLDHGLTQEYEKRWKASRGGTEVATVVDLSLTPDEAWGKFVGLRDGVARQSSAGQGGSLLAPVSVSSIFNRFAAFLVVFGLIVGGLSRWRGSRAFTVRCQKCGTPFCRKCQLTAAATGLCTQCHHLFVVRDGVSGPARMQKMVEVQKEEDRRNRMFRILSLLSPGAGQMYAQKVLLGVVLASLWYLLIAIVVMSRTVVPVIDTPSRLTGWWGTGLVALLLLLVFAVANRIGPDFNYQLSLQQRSPRRMAKAS